jgi:hypothetical protein
MAAMMCLAAGSHRAMVQSSSVPLPMASLGDFWFPTAQGWILREEEESANLKSLAQKSTDRPMEIFQIEFLHILKSENP